MKAVMESLQHRVGDTAKAPSTSVGIHASSPVGGRNKRNSFGCMVPKAPLKITFSLCQVVVLRWVLDIAVGVVRTIALRATEIQSLRSRSIKCTGWGKPNLHQWTMKIKLKLDFPLPVQSLKWILQTQTATLKKFKVCSKFTDWPDKFLVPFNPPCVNINWVNSWARLFFANQQLSWHSRCFLHPQPGSGSRNLHPRPSWGLSGLKSQP